MFTLRRLMIWAQISRGPADGVLGFIRLWEGPYYLYLVTESRMVGNIGDNEIFAIIETALVKLGPGGKSNKVSSEDETIEKR